MPAVCKQRGAVESAVVPLDVLKKGLRCWPPQDPLVGTTLWTVLGSVEGGVEGLAAPPMLAKWCLGPIWDRPLPVSRPPGRVGCASAVYPNVA